MATMQQRQLANSGMALTSTSATRASRGADATGVDDIDTTTTTNQLLDTKTVRLNTLGVNIRYAELGDRESPPVILLHGVPENLQAWYVVAPLLAERYHLLAIDWPGFGGSDPLPSPEDYTSRRFAEVVGDFMDSLGIPQASLVATDIALLPALLVGLEHPAP